MKYRIFFWIAALLPICALYSQSPAGMSYQALLYKPDGNPLQNQPVQLRISIVRDSAMGEPLMVELHQVKTNGSGLVSFVLGTGKVVLSSLREIDWREGPLFLQTEADLSGGNTYTLSAVTPILGVPYALHSGTTDSLHTSSSLYRGGTYAGALLFWDGSVWKELPKGPAGGQLAIDSSGLPVWRTFSLPRLSAARADSVKGIEVYLSSSVTDDGGYAITSRGFVLAESPGPLLESALVVRQGQGMGAFRLTASQLLPGRTYYVRSYASNLLGTAYGAESSFKVEGCKGNYPVELKLLVSDSLSDKDDPVFQLEPYDSMVTVEYILNGQVFTAERFTQILPNPGKDFKVFARGVDRLGCLYLSDTLEVQVYSTEYEAVCIPAFKHTPSLSALNAFSFAADKYIGRAAPFRLAYDLSGGYDVMYLYEGDFLPDGKLIGAVHLRSQVDTVYFTEEQTAIYLVFQNPGIIPETQSALSTLLSNLRQNADFIQLLGLVEADMKTLGYVDEYSSDKQVLLERIWTVLTPSSPQTVLGNEPSPLLIPKGKEVIYDANGNTLFYRVFAVNHQGNRLSKDFLFAGDDLPGLFSLFNLVSTVLTEVFKSELLKNYVFQIPGDAISVSELGVLPDSLILMIDNGFIPVSSPYYSRQRTAESLNTLLYVYQVITSIPPAKQLDDFLKLATSKLDDIKCKKKSYELLEEMGLFVVEVLKAELEGNRITQEEMIAKLKELCLEIGLAITDPSCFQLKPGLSKSLINFGKGLVKFVPTGLIYVLKDMTTGPRWAEHHMMRSDVGLTGKQYVTSNFNVGFSAIPGYDINPVPEFNIKEYPYYVVEYPPTNSKGVEKKGEPFVPSTFARPFSGGIKVEFKPFIESVSVEKETVKATPATFKLSKADNLVSWRIRNSMDGITSGQKMVLGSIQVGKNTPELLYGQIYKPTLRRETTFCVEKDYVCVEVLAPSVQADNYPVRFRILEGGGSLITSSDPRQLQEVTALAKKEQLQTNIGFSSIARVRWMRGESGTQKLEAAILDEKGNAYDKLVILDADSTEIYRLSAIGNWTVSNAEYPNNPHRNLELYSGGTGKYIGEGGQPFPNGGYNVTWRIVKNNNKYYLYESGFWHPGYNQFRVIGNNLPSENLTYPITLFKTYNNLGNGPIEALTYRKN